MSKFSEFRLTHGNGARTQDGYDVVVVRNDGTEVWVATTGENLSRLQVEIPDVDVINAAREAILNAAPGGGDGEDSVGTAMTAGLAYSAEAHRELRLHVSFLAPERTVYVQEGDEFVPVVQDNPWSDADKVAYLWDALKMALSDGGAA